MSARRPQGTATRSLKRVILNLCQTTKGPAKDDKAGVEFVEKMSVKPMFQDGCRRGSYIITADMEQFIPKHVIATANGTDAQTQKLTP
ncbi:hypothetical protein V5799_024669, partial [Amblyomma americanum]